MASLADVPETGLKRNGKLPNKILLQKFSVLAEGNDVERVKATKVILDHLVAQQASVEKARNLMTFEIIRAYMV